MNRVYFVRHGQSVKNAEKCFAGSLDTPLTDEGISGAESAGKQAQTLGIDLILSSPLSRARGTANVIADYIGYPLEDIRIEALLVERHYGAMEGQPYDPNINMDAVEGIETVDALLERAKRVIEILREIPATKPLVVSHGALGRAMRQHLYGIPYTEIHLTPPEIQIPNSTIIEWELGRLGLLPQ